MIRIFLGALLALFISNSASALVYSYTYQGQKLYCQNPVGPSTVCSFRSYGDIAPGYSAKLSIDEDILGLSLLNADLVFYFPSPGGSYSPFGSFVSSGPNEAVQLSLSGIYSRSPEDMVCGSLLRISTDALGNILSGSFSFCDGPPDGGFGDTYDLFNSGYAVYRSDGQGIWRTVAPVPLPAGIVLLLTSLAALFGLGSRKRRLGTTAKAAC